MRALKILVFYSILLIGISDAVAKEKDIPFGVDYLQEYNDHPYVYLAGQKTNLHLLDPAKIANGPKAKVDVESMKLQGNQLSFKPLRGISFYKVLVKNINGELIQQETVKANNFRPITIQARKMSTLHGGEIQVEVYTGVSKNDRYVIFPEKPAKKYFKIDKKDFPHFSPEDEVALLKKLDINNIKIGPIKRDGFAPDSAPYRIHFIDFLKSRNDMTKPELCIVELYSANGTRYLGRQEIKIQDPRNGYTYMDITGEKARDALSREDRLKLVVYPGLRDDLRGGVFSTKGVTKYISGLKVQVMEKAKADQIIAALKKSGAISFNHNRMIFNVTYFFERASNRFKVEFWLTNAKGEYIDILDSRLTNGKDDPINLTGQAVKDAAAKGHLGVRIYPGKYQAIPQYSEVFSEKDFYEFKPKNQKQMAKYIPGLSPEDGSKLIEGIKVGELKTKVIDHPRLGEQMEVIIPHNLKGSHSLRISAYNSNGSLVSEQVVQFFKGQDITFRLTPPDAAPLFGKGATSTLVIEPGLSLEEANRTMDLGADFITPHNMIGHNLFSGHSVRIGATLQLNGKVKLKKIKEAPSPAHVSTDR
ncbi:MAG: hypothetical protein K8R79_09135 [Calditrichales bacterium]|nr:hypothetical protein [Calditrichales bacterium]